MWYIFPQIHGLGRSKTAQLYAIKSAAEARYYLQHQVLGKHLIECTKIMLSLENISALAILGTTDAMKFKSSMTLFDAVASSGSVFEQALNKYFDGDRDSKTLELLNHETN